MTKITKSFENGVTEEKLQQGCNVVNFCSWQRLKAILETTENGDTIKGIIADENGLTLIFK